MCPGRENIYYYEAVNVVDDMRSDTLDCVNNSIPQLGEQVLMQIFWRHFSLYVLMHSQGWFHI